MIIYNYSDIDAEIIFEAVPFAVKAGESVEVDDRVAEHWLKIHAFLSTKKAVEAEPVKAKAPKAKKEDKKEEKSDKK